MGGKTSSAVKNRWNKKAYDRLLLVIPRGRKADLEQRASASGESVNGYLNRLIRSDLDMSETEWKAHAAETEQAETPDSP